MAPMVYIRGGTPTLGRPTSSPTVMAPGFMPMGAGAEDTGDGLGSPMAPMRTDQRPGTDASYRRLEGARGCVSRVHEEMRDVENVLLEMERDNAMNKTKLLAQRHLVFEKYFMATDSLMIQGVFGAWKQWLDQERHDREADGYSQRQARECALYERRLKDLEEESQSLRQACLMKRAETEAQVAPLRGAREEANLRAEQLEAVISSMGEIAARVTGLAEQAKPGGPKPACSALALGGANLTELAKGALHSILKDVDPNYLNPRVEVRSTTPQVVMRAAAPQIVASMPVAAGPQVAVATTPAPSSTVLMAPGLKPRGVGPPQLGAPLTPPGVMPGAMAPHRTGIM